jgi:hypothetical protein
MPPSSPRTSPARLDELSTDIGRNCDHLLPIAGGHPPAAEIQAGEDLLTVPQRRIAVGSQQRRDLLRFLPQLGRTRRPDNTGKHHAGDEPQNGKRQSSS